MTEAAMIQVRRNLNDMMERTQQALAKFEAGSSQHSLLENRLHALRVGLWLLEDETKEHVRDDLEQAVAPISSLIQKSGKAREKVKPGSWQHTMLSKNLHALVIVKDMLEKRLGVTVRKEPESHA